MKLILSKIRKFAGKGRTLFVLGRLHGPAFVPDADLALPEAPLLANPVLQGPGKTGLAETGDSPSPRYGMPGSPVFSRPPLSALDATGQSPA